MPKSGPMLEAKITGWSGFNSPPTAEVVLVTTEYEPQASTRPTLRLIQGERK